MARKNNYSKRLKTGIGRAGSTASDAMKITITTPVKNTAAIHKIAKSLVQKKKK